MRFGTIRVDGGTAAVRVEGDVAIELPGFADVAALLAAGDPRELGAVGGGARHALADVDFAPVVTQPSKIVCVGLNYRAHILETGREEPEHPTLFAKFADSLIGADDPLMLPPESSAVDWEGELAVIIGRDVRRATPEGAEAAIAGFTIAGDTSMRDWQYRTLQWLQGKMWARSTPLGPWMATPEEIPADAQITTRIDGVDKQRGDIHDLVHGPVHLVQYISTITPLHPGDVILTGTPDGVGHAREPKEHIHEGTLVEIEIDGIGVLRNRAVLG